MSVLEKILLEQARRARGGIVGGAKQLQRVTAPAVEERDRANRQAQQRGDKGRVLYPDEYGSIDEYRLALQLADENEQLYQRNMAQPSEMDAAQTQIRKQLRVDEPRPMRRVRQITPAEILPPSNNSYMGQGGPQVAGPSAPPVTEASEPPPRKAQIAPGWTPYAQPPAQTPTQAPLSPKEQKRALKQKLKEDLAFELRRDMGQFAESGEFSPGVPRFTKGVEFNQRAREALEAPYEKQLAAYENSQADAQRAAEAKRRSDPAYMREMAALAASAGDAAGSMSYDMGPSGVTAQVNPVARDIGTGVATSPLTVLQGLTDSAQSIGNLGLQLYQGYQNLGRAAFGQAPRPAPQFDIPDNPALRAPDPMTGDGGGDLHSYTGDAVRFITPFVATRTGIGKAMPGGGFVPQIAKDAAAVGIGYEGSTPRAVDVLTPEQVEDLPPYLSDYVEWLRKREGGDLGGRAKNAVEDLTFSSALLAPLLGVRGLQAASGQFKRAPAAAQGPRMETLPGGDVFPRTSLDDLAPTQVRQIAVERGLDPNGPIERVTRRIQEAEQTRPATPRQADPGPQAIARAGEDEIDVPMNPDPNTPTDRRNFRNIPSIPMPPSPIVGGTAGAAFGALDGDEDVFGEAATMAAAGAIAPIVAMRGGNSVLSAVAKARGGRGLLEARDERIAADVVRNILSKGGAKTPEEALALAERVLAGKPGGALDLTQEGVNTTAGLTRLPGKTGQAARARYEDLFETRTGRIEADIQDATGFDPLTVRGDLDEMRAAAKEKAKPLYDELADKYETITSKRLDQISNLDLLKPFVEEADDYATFLRQSRGEEMSDFRYWDMVKRAIDLKEQSLIARNERVPFPLEDARADLVRELDRLMPEYATARAVGGESPKMGKAFKEGEVALTRRPGPEDIAREVARWRDDPQSAAVAAAGEALGSPLTAYQAGVIREMARRADAGRTLGGLLSTNAGRKLSEVFGPDAAAQLQRRFKADARVMENAARTNPNLNSVTPQAQMGAATLPEMVGRGADVFRRGVVNTALDFGINALKDARFTPGQRDRMGEMLLGGITTDNLNRIYRPKRRGERPPPASTPPPNTPPSGPAGGPAGGMTRGGPLSDFQSGQGAGPAAMPMARTGGPRKRTDAPARDVDTSQVEALWGGTDDIAFRNALEELGTRSPAEVAAAYTKLLGRPPKSGMSRPRMLQDIGDKRLTNVRSARAAEYFSGRPNQGAAPMPPGLDPAISRPPPPSAATAPPTPRAPPEAERAIATHIEQLQARIPPDQVAREMQALRERVDAFLQNLTREVEALQASRIARDGGDKPFGPREQFAIREREAQIAAEMKELKAQEAVARAWQERLGAFKATRAGQRGATRTPDIDADTVERVAPKRRTAAPQAAPRRARAPVPVGPLSNEAMELAAQDIARGTPPNLAAFTPPEKALIQKRARALSASGEATPVVPPEAAPSAMRPPKRAESGVKADVRDLAVDEQISSAYSSLARRSDDWVWMRDLRAKLGHLSREEVDAALRRMYSDKRINMTLSEDQGRLTRADKDAAMPFGVSRVDLISAVKSPAQPTPIASALGPKKRAEKVRIPKERRLPADALRRGKTAEMFDDPMPPMPKDIGELIALADKPGMYGRVMDHIDGLSNSAALAALPPSKALEIRQRMSQFRDFNLPEAGERARELLRSEIDGVVVRSSTMMNGPTTRTTEYGRLRRKAEKKNTPDKAGMLRTGALETARKAGYEGRDIGEAKEWVAAGAKGLDRSREGILKRAREQGFDTDTPYYSGFYRDIKNKGMYWHTDSPDIAETYAVKKSNFGVPSDATPTIEKVFVKKNNVLVINADGALWNRIPVSNSSLKKNIDLSEYRTSSYVSTSTIAELARRNGYSGVKFRNVLDTFDANSDPLPSNVLVVFDGDARRSVNAVFDPDNVGSSSLLASSPTGGGAAVGAMAGFGTDNDVPMQERVRNAAIGALGGGAVGAAAGRVAARGNFKPPRRVDQASMMGPPKRADAGSMGPPKMADAGNIARARAAGFDTENEWVHYSDKAVTEVTLEKGDLGLHIMRSDAETDPLLTNRASAQRLFTKGTFAQTPDLQEWHSPVSYNEWRRIRPDEWDPRYEALWADLDRAARRILLPAVAEAKKAKRSNTTLFEDKKLSAMWRGLVRDAAKKHGVSGFEYVNEEEATGGISRLVLDPSAARETRAQFDPRKRDGGVLLASSPTGGGAAVGALTGYSLDEEDRGRGALIGALGGGAIGAAAGRVAARGNLKPPRRVDQASMMGPRKMEKQTAWDNALQRPEVQNWGKGHKVYRAVHSTTADVDKFDSAFIGRSDPGWKGRGHYFYEATPEKVGKRSKGSGFQYGQHERWDSDALKDGSNTVPVLIRMKKPFTSVDAKNPRVAKKFAEAGYQGVTRDSRTGAPLEVQSPGLVRGYDASPEDAAVFTAVAQKLGYDGAAWGGEIVVFPGSEANIRSVNAAFDPDNVGSSSLLASSPTGSAAALGAMAGFGADNDVPMQERVRNAAIGALGGGAIGAAAGRVAARGNFKPPPGADMNFMLGPRAKSADPKALAYAKQLKSQGASRDVIWDLTRDERGQPWWEVRPGQWRTPKATGQVRVRNPRGVGPLSDQVSFPMLYDEYPETAKLKTDTRIAAPTYADKEVDAAINKVRSIASNDQKTPTDWEYDLLPHLSDPESKKQMRQILDRMSRSSKARTFSLAQIAMEARLRRKYHGAYMLSGSVPKQGFIGRMLGRPQPDPVRIDLPTPMRVKGGGSGPGPAESTAVHEATHAVQDIEEYPFLRDAVRPYLNRPSEREAFLNQYQYGWTQEELNAVYPWEVSPEALGHFVGNRSGDKQPKYYKPGTPSMVASKIVDDNGNVVAETKPEFEMQPRERWNDTTVDRGLSGEWAGDSGGRTLRGHTFLSVREFENATKEARPLPRRRTNGPSPKVIQPGERLPRAAKLPPPTKGTMLDFTRSIGEQDPAVRGKLLTLAEKLKIKPYEGLVANGERWADELQDVAEYLSYHGGYELVADAVIKAKKSGMTLDQMIESEIKPKLDRLVGEYSLDPADTANIMKAQMDSARMLYQETTYVTGETTPAHLLFEDIVATLKNDAKVRGVGEDQVIQKLRAAGIHGAHFRPVGAQPATKLEAEIKRATQERNRLFREKRVIVAGGSSGFPQYAKRLAEIEARETELKDKLFALHRQAKEEGSLTEKTVPDRGQSFIIFDASAPKQSTRSMFGSGRFDILGVPFVGGVGAGGAVIASEDKGEQSPRLAPRRKSDLKGRAPTGPRRRMDYAAQRQ